eukprot:3802871-Amphidinium_carterae.1
MNLLQQREVPAYIVAKQQWPRYLVGNPPVSNLANPANQGPPPKKEPGGFHVTALIAWYSVGPGKNFHCSPIPDFH